MAQHLAQPGGLRQALHLKLRVVASRVDAQRADVEHAVEQRLVDLHRADRGELDLGVLLGQEALVQSDAVVVDGHGRRPVHEPPQDEGDDSNDRGNEDHAQDEEERMAPEHRRMGLVARRHEGFLTVRDEDTTFGRTMRSSDDTGASPGGVPAGGILTRSPSTPNRQCRCESASTDRHSQPPTSRL